MTKKKKLGILGLLVILVVFGAVIVYRDNSQSKIEITGTAVDALKDYGISVVGDGDVKVNVVPVEDAKLPPAPSLDRSTKALIEIHPESYRNALSQIADYTSKLKSDPKNVANWVMLGVFRKAIGDYEGARDVWEYAKLLNTTYVVPYNNLGDLYHFSLRDLVKSEENWKKAIEVDPSYVPAYRGLYELYKYSYTEKASEIPAVLKKGIAKNPDATDLRVLLDEYEKSVR